MIDSHVHLNREEFGTEQPEILARARAAGVTHFLNVGYDLDSSAESPGPGSGPCRDLCHLWGAPP